MKHDRWTTDLPPYKLSRSPWLSWARGITNNTISKTILLLFQCKCVVEIQNLHDVQISVLRVWYYFKASCSSLLKYFSFVTLIALLDLSSDKHLMSLPPPAVLKLIFKNFQSSHARHSMRPAGFQLRTGFENDSEIFFLILQRKQMWRLLIRTVCARLFVGQITRSSKFSQYYQRSMNM